MSTPNFHTFLDRENVVGSDYEDVLALYRTAALGRDDGVYRFEEADNGSVLVHGRIETLVLAHREARDLFTRTLERTYAHGGDIESWAAEQRACARSE